MNLRPKDLQQLLGGGIQFTGEGYPLDALADRLRALADRLGVQVYLEPGEAAITGAASLEVTVLDILNNGKDLAIVDSSVEAHMLDLLIYRISGKMEVEGDHPYMICGKSCLAGDIFGEFNFPAPLNPAKTNTLNFLTYANQDLSNKTPMLLCLSIEKNTII